MARTPPQFEFPAPLDYIETTVPPGLALAEYRRSRPRQRARWRRLRHRTSR